MNTIATKRFFIRTEKATVKVHWAAQTSGSPEVFEFSNTDSNPDNDLNRFHLVEEGAGQ